MKKTAPPSAKLLALVAMILIMVTGCKKTDESETVTDIDGNVYKTVVIGTQTWMAENLKTTKYNDGTQIPNVTAKSQWDNLTTDAYCWYNNDAAANKATYGALYNWYAVDTKKLCPTGWHVPSDAEWTTLIDFLGGKDYAGGKLKEKGTAHWAAPNTDASDEYGFKALPAGYRSTDREFLEIGEYSLWYTSTMQDATGAFYYYIGYEGGELHKSSLYIRMGASVRCVKD